MSEPSEQLINALRRMAASETGHALADVQLGGGAYSAEWLQWALSLPEYMPSEDTQAQDPETGEFAFTVDFHAVGEVPIM